MFVRWRPAQCMHTVASTWHFHVHAIESCPRAVRILTSHEGALALHRTHIWHAQTRLRHREVHSSTERVGRTAVESVKCESVINAPVMQLLVRAVIAAAPA